MKLKSNRPQRFYSSDHPRACRESQNKLSTLSKPCPWCSRIEEETHDLLQVNASDAVKYVNKSLMTSLRRKYDLQFQSSVT